MCAVLKVSSSGFYNWRNNQGETETENNRMKKEIQQKIKRSFYESFGTYGSPRVHQDLIAWGYTASLKTVARYMSEMGLSATPRKKYVVTTNSNHNLPIYSNLVKRNFQIDKPNAVWVADITYIRTIEGWLYLASIMDLFSRKIISWNLGITMKTDLVLKPLKEALTTRKPSPGLIHHSDQGSQYCSQAYIESLNEEQAKVSMSRKGNPYDNACIESFHATLKKEWVYRFKYKTRAEAEKSVNHFIENYNNKRRHSSLGYYSPNRFERKYHLSPEPSHLA